MLFNVSLIAVWGILYENIHHFIQFEIDTTILERLEEFYIDMRYLGDMKRLIIKDKTS